MNRKILINALAAIALLGLTACNQPAKDGAAGAGTTTGSTASKAGAAKADTAKTAVKGDSALVPVGGSYTKGGGADALVTIIEFSDFQCPFCSRVNPTLKSIKEKYGNKVRVAFKHNPLSFHKDAPLASQYALAAGEQGKFWEFHDKLFENQRKLKEADLDGYGKELGLDVAKLKKDANSDKIKAAMKADMDLGKKVGARGTPNFFINGKQLSGAQPLDRFTAVIDAELKAAESIKDKSTVYAARVKANYKAPAARPDAKKKGADTKTVYKIPGTGLYPMGGKEPLVTIIEFSEFQCPFCKRVLPTTEKIKKTYGDDVQILFKHNPLPFHKDAPLASQYALAAGVQGKFWEMHDKIFANQKQIKEDNLKAYGKELGLDVAKLTADANSAETKAIIKADQKLGAQFGARGTPNFFVNGRQVTGARPFEAFKTIIDEEIKKANALIAKGTPRSGVYAALTAKGLTKAAAPKRKPNNRAPDTTVYKVPVNSADAVKGNADALVTIIEFSEFQCPFCKRVGPSMAQIDKKYGKDVRVVFKHNPLPFHKDAPLASEAALAAGAQGKFWEMHDKLFSNQKQLKRANIDGYAKELGLDMGKFAAALDGGTFKAQIKADQALARSIGAGGTPNFFINGRKLVGAQPFASFEKLIDAQLIKAKALVAKGTPRNKVYEELTKNGATKPAKAAAGKPPVDDKKVYPVKTTSADPFKGGKNAPITIVEFSDFQCPFCGRVNPTLKQVQDKYGDKVKIVFKQNPLSFHKDAPLAAEATLAAHAQGKFWPMHDLLFKNQRALKRPELEKYAQEIGLNLEKFKADLDSHKFKAQVDGDIAEARKHGATGTPSFFINGRKLRGAQPFPSFERVIEEELKKIK
jgi:protein-disulfide isomerase